MHSSGRVSLNNSVFAGRIKRSDGQSNRGINSSCQFISEVYKPNSKQFVKSIDKEPRPTTVLKTTTYGIGGIIKNEKTVTSAGTDSKMSFSQTNEMALQSVKRSIATKDAIIADQFLNASFINRTNRRLSKIQKLAYGFGAGVFIFALTISAQTMLTNMQTKNKVGVLGTSQATDDTGVKQGSGSSPAEEKPSDNAILNYHPSDPEYPRYLRIPEIDVFARVKDLGTTPAGAIDAPWNLYDVGWYRGSAKPGNSIGASLLLGHVSGWTAPGVFKRINELKSGSRIEVEKGTGEKIEYEVIKTESISLDKLKMAEILSTEVIGQHDLKLMTCSGKFDAASDHYTERFVVYAKVLK